MPPVVTAVVVKDGFFQGSGLLGLCPLIGGQPGTACEGAKDGEQG